MSLSAQLQALLVPSGTEFPGTVQEFLDLIASYMEITGLNPFSGINFGPTTPDADSRDRPWFKTTNSGAPIGWFAWDGSAWSPIPQIIPSGSTDDRPADPDEGEQYFDTDIDVALIFERSEWRTLSGSPGDVKAVKANTIEEAIEKNPGWIQDPDSLGRVIGGAGDGAGLTPRPYGLQYGSETTTLAEDNLPPHVHSYLSHTHVPWNADGNVSAATGNLASFVNNDTLNTGDTPAIGEGPNPFLISQPTIFYWTLTKS